MSNKLELDLCILIPCYNNLQGLINSIKSINYYADKYLVVVVDDGSDEPLSEEDIKQNLDFKSIKVINLDTNKGITTALNTGLVWIIENLNVPYIARLDCNDICHSERFYKQINYLNQNKEVGLIGSWCIFKKSDNSFSYKYITPTKHIEIIKAMYFRNVFIHPTVVMRTEILVSVGHYPTNYLHVEDYALFWKILKQSKTAILDQYLVTCEINSNGISIKNRRKQLIGRKKVINAFGCSKWFKSIGILKLKVLLLIPYMLILKMKNA